MKKVLTISLFSALLGWALPSYANSASAPQAAVEAKKAEGVWIDVRTADEFNQGHLQDAVNIEHREIGEKISQLKLAKDAQINLYCRSGRRAEVAMAELKKLGYTNVTNHGGYDDLIQQGLK